MSYRDATPLYPKILIERLPRERMAGIVFVPEDSNKPVHEGVVLKVWKPRSANVSADVSRLVDITRRFHRREPLTDAEVNEGYDLMDKLGTQGRPLESAVKPGDIVLFPHHAGSQQEDPADPDVCFIHEGEILGVIEPVALEGTVDHLLSAATVGYVDTYAAHMAMQDRIKRSLVLVPRRSFTQSGKSTDGVR